MWQSFRLKFTLARHTREKSQKSSTVFLLFSRRVLCEKRKKPFQEMIKSSGRIDLLWAVRCSGIMWWNPIQVIPWKSCKCKLRVASSQKAFACFWDFYDSLERQPKHNNLCGSLFNPDPMTFYIFYIRKRRIRFYAKLFFSIQPSQVIYVDQTIPIKITENRRFCIDFPHEFQLN